MTNVEKSKPFRQKDIGRKMKMHGCELENVENCTYLGGNMTFDLKCKKEIKIRVAKA